MKEKDQRIFELFLHILNLIDVITDIIAMGSLGSKKLVAHLLLVLFTIIIERITQVVNYYYFIRKMEIENKIISDLNLNKQLLYRACFLDLLIFFKANYSQKIESTPVLKPALQHRNYVSMQSQTIHAYFSSCVCLFLQSHGMIYWGSSDPMIIISMVFHFIIISISNTTIYIKQVDSKQFLQLFIKNILYIISFIGFWSLASELARPRFLLAHLFASILFLILIYILYTNNQVLPKDLAIIQQPKNIVSRQDINNHNSQQQNEKKTATNQQIQAKQEIQNQFEMDLNNQKLNKNIVQLEDISSLNPNQDQSKQQIQTVGLTQDYMRKKEEGDTQAVNTPLYIKQNLSNFSRMPLNYPQINSNDLTNPPHNYDGLNQDEIIAHDINNNNNLQQQNLYQINDKIQQHLDQNTHLNSGRDDSKVRQSINSVQNNNNLLPLKLQTEGYKYQIATDGENQEYVIKFDDDSSSQQKSIQMDLPETPQYQNGVQKKGKDQAMKPVSVAQLQNDDHLNNLTPKQQYDTAMKSPMTTYPEQLRTDEVQIINLKDEIINIHQPNQPEEECQLSMTIPQQQQKSVETSKLQQAKYHAMIALKFVTCGFFFLMNYNKEIFVAGFKYLNKPLSSFKIANLVFLFAFEVTFNKTDFFPGLRVISIICGILYILIEASYLVGFNYKNTFIFEIFTKIQQKLNQRKQNQQKP